MEETIFETVLFWVMEIISQSGYGGIFLLMAAESALIPIPSEAIMTFSGFLVAQGRFTLFGVAVAGALGNLFGSWLAYGLGYFGHERIVKKLIKKYGKFILLTEDDFDAAVKIFYKNGLWFVAVARLMPALRTVISLPAGLAKVPLLKFSLVTFSFSFIWSYLLALAGTKLGENWEIIRPVFRKFDIVIEAFVIIFIGAYVYYKFRNKKISAQKT